MTDDTTGTETARETCGATTESGTPCQKGADHGGGHWFMSDDQYACLRAEHYDPLAVLSLQPLVHLDVPCPRNAPTAPTEARGLGEVRAALAAAFSGDEYEENAAAAAGEGEWSWFKWLATTTVDAVLAERKEVR